MQYIILIISGFTTLISQHLSHISMASQTEQPLHFVLIPFMAPGHIIPMIDMAKLFAKRGINTTIIVTPLDATRFHPVISRAIRSGLSIQLIKIPFPAEEAGLPHGCENIDCLPSYDLMEKFSFALNMWQIPVEQVLRNLIPIPSCIICDKHIAWTAETCKNLEIPRITFDGMNCFTQVVVESLYISRIHEHVPETEPFVVPDLPDKVGFTRKQLPGLLNPTGSDKLAYFREQVKKTECQAYGVVVNSFEELEKEYVENFKNLRSGKVWCIGPLSLCGDDSLSDKAERGNKDSVDGEKCLKWLDGKKQASVIYACLGSLSRLSTSQFIELALGLEFSGHDFILVAKKVGGKSIEIEKWILESGFEERTKNRGFLIRGWAPQVMILSHKAVGGFLTHCGWNSTLEGICSGLPMVTWPMFGEQFLNEKLVVGILGIGVRVGAETVVHLGEEEKTENTVMKNEIKAAILQIMDEGKEGCERRVRAKELGEIARRSVEVVGSSHLNAGLFVQDIAQLVHKR